MSERWEPIRKAAPWIVQSSFSGAVACEGCGQHASFPWPSPDATVAAARSAFATRHAASCSAEADSRLALVFS